MEPPYFETSHLKRRTSPITPAFLCSPRRPLVRFLAQPGTRRYIINRDVPDTTLPDTGFNRIVIYRIVASLNIRVRE